MDAATPYGSGGPVARDEVVSLARMSAPRGTADVLPAEARRWHRLEKVTADVARRYGFGEIRTPIFEHTELFARGIGEGTDVVQKEMYSFADRGERSLTLRPEGTAGVVRAYLERRLDAEAQPIKVYYSGPMFRYERPQAGRSRQFHQLGAECIGTMDPAADVEMISFVVRLFAELGLHNFDVLLNSIGCPVCRPAYVQSLREALADVRDDLCRTCHDRYERNTLRILDCKNEACQQLTADVPLLLDALCDECDDHFTQVKSYMEELGFAYTIAPRLVRGLDYYTRTVFEFISPDLGAQDALGGGGRYDGLVETFGGRPTPAVGFAAGMERLLLAMAEAGEEGPEPGIDVFIASVGDAGRRATIGLAERLRVAGLAAEIDYMDRGLRAQMRQANRVGARAVAVVGDDEAADGMMQLRDMESGTQHEVSLTDTDAVQQLLQTMRGGGNE